MITPEIRNILESESCRKLIDGDRIRFPKDGSINKYLLRTERKLGLEEHSFHDIRRRIAQDKYDEFRTSGMSRSDSLRAVSAWLNHGTGSTEDAVRIVYCESMVDRRRGRENYFFASSNFLR